MPFSPLALVFLAGGLWGRVLPPSSVPPIHMFSDMFPLLSALLDPATLSSGGTPAAIPEESARNRISAGQVSAGSLLSFGLAPGTPSPARPGRGSGRQTEGQRVDVVGGERAENEEEEGVEAPGGLAQGAMIHVSQTVLNTEVSPCTKRELPQLGKFFASYGHTQEDKAAGNSTASRLAALALSSPSAAAAPTSPPAPTTSAELLWEQLVEAFPAARMAAGRETELTPDSVVSFLLTTIESQRAVIKEQQEVNAELKAQVELAWESSADLAAEYMRGQDRKTKENKELRDGLADSKIVIASLKSRRGRRERFWDQYLAQSEAK